MEGGGDAGGRQKGNEYKRGVYSADGWLRLVKNLSLPRWCALSRNYYGYFHFLSPIYSGSNLHRHRVYLPAFLPAQIYWTTYCLFMLQVPSDSHLSPLLASTTLHDIILRHTRAC